MASPAAGLEVPTLVGWPVVGSIRGLRRDYLGTIVRADREVGGLARIVAGPPGWRLTVYTVTSPPLIEEVLSAPERFGKAHPGYRELRRALGNNVLTSEDETWHRQRRLLAPIFTRRRVQESYAQVMTDEAERLVERWRPRAREGRTVDAYPELVGMASRVSGRILFGADMSAATELLARFRRVNDQLLRRAVSPHPLPARLPTPRNRRMNRGLHETRAIVDELITRRRAAAEAAGGHRQTDMLGLLLAAQVEGVKGDAADRLTDREVADQMMLFLLAGHDTTSVTLACVLLLLAQHPAWQQRLQEEIDGVLLGRPATLDDLPRLPWTRRVVSEAMRLYPAAHGVGRSPRTDQLLGGHRIPAGAWVEISIWGVHRSPRVWPDPERFDPIRFELAEGVDPGGHRHAYLPFGAGPRACIGAAIALPEIQVTLATLLQAYAIRTTQPAISVHAAITLLPTGRVPILLHSR
ncbi:MAG TPA: cytochrome P450 [Microlunatus sp.]|nr:cytochrome P450 [Microlunatus sp.]